MKPLVIAAYIVSVLLISGFMNANASTLAAYFPSQYQSPVKIHDVTVSSSGPVLNVWGSIPNPCHSQPTASLIQNPAAPEQLVIHMSSTMPLDNCIARVDDFNTSVNMQTLVRAARVEIESAKSYTIKFQNFDFAIEVQGAELL